MDGKRRNAHAQQNCEAWFYLDNLSRISIFVRTVPNGPTVMCTISRRQLAKWIAARAKMKL